MMTQKNILLSTVTESRWTDTAFKESEVALALEGEKEERFIDDLSGEGTVTVEIAYKAED